MLFIDFCQIFWITVQHKVSIITSVNNLKVCNGVERFKQSSKKHKLIKLADV